MILKGSQRSGAADLAAHLMNNRDNDHIELVELRGFMADDLHGALSEAHAISKATQCKQFMFSVSLNPPEHAVLGEQDFIDAADKVEAALGLDGQPRAIVIHEKEGRRHAHLVFSRINADEMKAINLPFYKSKLTDLSRDLYLDHGWSLPKGLQTHGGKSPLNFTLAQWQQAKRIDLDPREIKQVLQEAWQHSDNLRGFQNGLEERGYFIARGDRRGFVALDVQGNIYSLSRWAGIKSKDLTAKLGTPDDLRSVTEVKADLKSRASDKFKGFITEVKTKHAHDLAPLIDERTELVAQHRSERKKMRDGQDKRWHAETKTRSDRLNKGVRGLFDWVSGKAKQTHKHNETEAYQSLLRDRKQRDDLGKAQMGDRQELQKRFDKLHRKHREDRKILARDVASFLRKSKYSDKAKGREKNRAQEPPPFRGRKRGPELTP